MVSNKRKLGGVEDLGSIGSPGFALGVNDNGSIVGVTEWEGLGSSAFLWREKEGMTSLGGLGGLNMFAQDINNSGTIVGWGTVPTDGPESVFDRRAFVWQESAGVVDLLGVPSEAYTIDESGWIVGVLNVGGEVGVPESGTTFGMMMLGLLGIVWTRWASSQGYLVWRENKGANLSAGIRGILPYQGADRMGRLLKSVRIEGLLKH